LIHDTWFEKDTHDIPLPSSDKTMNDTLCGEATPLLILHDIVIPCDDDGPSCDMLGHNPKLTWHELSWKGKHGL